MAVPAFTLFDAMLGYHTGPWRFALNLSNLADKTYAATTGVIRNAGGADQAQFNPGEGRAVYVGVSKTF